jgi:diadenosine tetraphosphate (Ap4A) HIT family hydrolase
VIVTDGCLVCRELREEVDVPGGVLDEGLAAAFHVPPYCEPLVFAGHLLVTPKRHAVDFAALADDEAGEVGRVIATYSRLLRNAGATAVYVATIGHSVPHLHVHLLPRWPETPEDVPWHAVDEWEGARRIRAEEIAQFVRDLGR